MVNNLQYQLVTKRILPQRMGGMGGENAKLRGLGLMALRLLFRFIKLYSCR